MGASGGSAEVGLYDLNGRRVKTLARGSFAGGQQTVTWDGRDDRGAPVRNGIYFLRARSFGHDELLKLVVTR